MKNALYAMGLAVAALTGCAGIDWTGEGASQPGEEKMTVTGSMIPRKQVPDGVKTVDKDQVARTLDHLGTNNGVK